MCRSTPESASRRILISAASISTNYRRKSRSNEASSSFRDRVSRDRRQRGGVVVRRLQRRHQSCLGRSGGGSHSEKECRPRRKPEGKRQRPHVRQHLHRLSPLLLPRVGLPPNGQ